MAIVEKVEVVSRQKSSTGIPERRPSSAFIENQLLSGEPSMFWVDEERLHEYLGLELERLSKPKSA
jgi:hypothetical protein